ncbi:MAG: hypothetical protein ACO1QB_17515 [Verrucomicrobiales bacterium]
MNKYIFQNIICVMSSFLLYAAAAQGAEPVHADAQKMIPFSLEQLIKAADLVVHGTVEEVTAKRDQRSQIYTEIIVNVAEVWKGEAATGRLRVVQGGGVLGEARLVISGQPTFDPGEETVLFLVLNHRKEAVVYAMSQGKFKVRSFGKGNEKNVSNPFHGAAGEIPAHPESKASNAGDLTSSLALDKLKETVLKVQKKP